MSLATRIEKQVIPPGDEFITADPAPAGYQAGGNYRERSLAAQRAGGLGLTIVVLLLLVAIVFARWQAMPAPPPKPAPLVVELLPLAAPPTPVEEVKEGPKRVEQKQQKVVERHDPPLPISPAAIARAQAMDEAPQPVPSKIVVPETTAPKSMPAPPATRAANDAERTWEALLLARLQKFRRYPASARVRRQEGVALVRFRMNRSGNVLSATLLRSSGSALLDRAAIETVHRADPLPEIPKERPDEVELTVPIEFFIGR